MVPELQVFVLVRVTVNAPLVRASICLTNNPYWDTYWNRYWYSCQCECRLTWEWGWHPTEMTGCWLLSTVDQDTYWRTNPTGACNHSAHLTVSLLLQLVHEVSTRLPAYTNNYQDLPVNVIPSYKSISTLWRWGVCKFQQKHKRHFISI